MRTVKHSMKWETRFVLRSGSMVVKEAMEEIGGDIRYLVILRSDGKYAVRSLYDEQGSLQDILLKIADLVGPTILDMRLEEVPKLCEPCEPISVDDTADLAGERQKNSPNGWTVVLDGSKEVGVLEKATRAGVMGGRVPRLLGREFVFGRDSEEPEKGGRVCIACGAAFAYYALHETENEDLQFVCPHCQQPQEVSCP